jgi:predicted metal-binding protein
MEKVLIVGCQRVMDTVCIACSRCHVGFNRRAGEFTRYPAGDGVELTGILGCGDCPGAGIVPRLAQMALWNRPMGEVPTKVHIAPCVRDHCPHSEVLIKKITAKAGVEVILGAHPYLPDKVFAQAR